MAFIIFQQLLSIANVVRASGVLTVPLCVRVIVALTVNKTQAFVTTANGACMEPTVAYHVITAVPVVSERTEIVPTAIQAYGEKCVRRHVA